jgi:GNAT superfamily N-acetyltransferase
MKLFINFLESLRKEDPLLIESIKSAYNLLESKSLVGDKGEKIEIDGGYIDIQYKDTMYSPRKQSVIDFYVPEESRNQGIGDRLIKKALEKFDDLGAQVSSKPSLHLFFKNGFRNPELVSGTYEEHLKMFEENGGSLFLAKNNKVLTESIGNNWKEHLQSLKQEIAREAQAIYDEWVDALKHDEAEEYAGGGICHFIADKICDVVNRSGNYDCKTISYDHVQHVATICRPLYIEDDEGVIEVCTIDVPYYLYETGGGFSWEPLEDVEIVPNDVTFYYQTMDLENFEDI